MLLTSLMGPVYTAHQCCDLCQVASLDCDPPTQNPQCCHCGCARGRDKLRQECSFLLTRKAIMPTPHINGVVETCLYSDDLARSVRFYQEQLGLRLLESGERLCVFSVADKQVLLIFRSGGTMEPIHTPGGMIPPHGA